MYLVREMGLSDATGLDITDSKQQDLCSRGPAVENGVIVACKNQELWQWCVSVCDNLSVMSAMRVRLLWGTVGCVRYCCVMFCIMKRSFCGEHCGS